MLVRLVYHAQGIVCPVTCLMHLAAAVEIKSRARAVRPCVVVAGGREPVHWEQYPGHQFIHTIGALSCCSAGGCWRDRTESLGDGDPRDDPGRRCVDVVNHLPRCMTLITSEDVIRSVSKYFEAGMVGYMSESEQVEGRKGITESLLNPFEQLSLTKVNARIECERYIRTLSDYSCSSHGRGIVIAAGGCRYFVGAWVTINMLRMLGCTLPIEVWHLGETELTPKMEQILKPLGVKCVDAFKLRARKPSRILNGWELKCYAVMHSEFEEVLFLDADNVPVLNPEGLFESSEYSRFDAVFWPDIQDFEKTRNAWELLGLRRSDSPEFESGQMLINKRKTWKALRLAMWLNENSDFFYRYLHGDKETFHLAFEKLKQPYFLVQTPTHVLAGTMCQHDLKGRRMFQHRNTDKWNLFANNPRVEDFRHEEECREFVRELQKTWSGNMEFHHEFEAIHQSQTEAEPPSLACGMISCKQREPMRMQTLDRLGKTDLSSFDVLIELDDGSESDPKISQTRTAWRLLDRFLNEREEDYLLFLEDDLDFNRNLLANLTSWPPLLHRRIWLASLFNPGLIEDACDVPARSYLVRAERVFGSQALVVSRPAASLFIKQWDTISGMQDIKMSRLVGRLEKPIWYHSPSLVQHLGQRSTWGGSYFIATDFDRDWLAVSQSRFERKNL